MSDRDGKIERRTLTILADEAFGKNNFYKALELYTKARNFQKLRSRGRYLANKGFLAYAATFLSAAGCEFNDENIAAIAARQLEKGIYFTFVEICVKMNAKNELIGYGNLLLSQNRFLMAMILFDKAQMPFPKEILNRKRRDTFKNEIIEYMERGNYPEYAIKGYRILEDYPRLLDLSIACLQNGWLIDAMTAYKEALKGKLDENVLSRYGEIAASFANRYLVQGDFKEGMILCKTIGIKPDRSELITCGNMNFLGQPIFCGKIFYYAMKAFKMAGTTPSKERIEKAGDDFIKDHMLLQAIDFYEAAECSDKLWSIIKKYGSKEYSCSSYNDIIEKAARSIARIEERKSKRKRK